MTTGLADSRKTPGINLAIILGGAGTSSGVAARRTLLQGNAILSGRAGTLNALTSPQIAITAGTMTAAGTPTFCASADDAGAFAGRGSELHGMAISFFAQYPAGTLYIQAVADAAGTAASLACTFATTATAAYTVRIYACGQVIEVPVESGATATAIATAVADAINDADTLPFIAQFSAGQLTLTAKCTGPRGNTLTCAFSFISAAGLETVITTGSTSSGAATTGILSGGTQESGEYFFASGATQDSWANALANVLVQKRQQGVVGCIGASAAAVTLATGQNTSRLQLVWHYNSRLPIWQVAAQACAARLIGDSVAGGLLVGEETDPAANLCGLELVSVPAQNTIADQPTSTEIESALNNGITPLAPSANRPGFVTVVRSTTTRCLSAGVPNFAVIDTSIVTSVDFVADGLQATLGTTYAGFKLAPNSADGLPPRSERTTTPDLIRAVIARELKLYEERAILIDVDANLPLLTVIASTVTPGRVDCVIPTEVIPGLILLGGDVRQLS